MSPSSTLSFFLFFSPLSNSLSFLPLSLLSLLPPPSHKKLNRYDHVIASPRPDKWNLRAVFFIASVLAGVAMLSSLLLLWGALSSHQPKSMFRAFGLPPMPYEKIITAIYLKVSISDFLTLFSSRTISWFWTSKPALPLLCAASVALLTSTILGTFWPTADISPEGQSGFSILEHLPVVGLGRSAISKEWVDGEYRDTKLWPVWIWSFCLVFWLVQDAAKVLAWKLLYKYDIFQIKTGTMVAMRATTRFDDPARPLARVSAGLIEEKLLDKKLANAEQALKSDPKAAAGMHLARTSLGRGSGPDGRGRSAEEVRAAFERVSAGMLPESQQAASAHMDQVRRATESLQRVSAAMARQSMDAGQRALQEVEKNAIDKL